ncbi:MAG: branched-chain amino acid ABC transporter permease [Candidatus Heimdallarchaeota archaeon]
MVRRKKVTYAGLLELLSGILGIIPPIFIALVMKFPTFEKILSIVEIILPWRGGFHFTVFLIPPFILGWALLAQEPWARSFTVIYASIDIISDFLAVDIAGIIVNLSVLVYLNSYEVREVFMGRTYRELFNTLPKCFERTTKNILITMKASLSAIKTPKKDQLLSKHAIVLYLLILLVIAPLLLNDRWISTLTLFLTFSVLATSWDLLGGYTGQISFGHAAFFGIGAYTGVILNIKYEISPWVGFFAAGIFAAELGILVGLPCSRMRIPYLFITTLAFAEALRLIVQNTVSLTRGASGLQVQEDLITFGIDLHGRKLSYFYLGLIIFLILIGFMYILTNRSEIGLIFKSIREDEVLAGSLGVDIVGYKILAFGFGSFIAGLIGAFYAFSIRVLTPDLLGITWTANIISIVVIGGMGTILGPIIAAFLLTILSELLRTIGLIIWNLIIQGLAVILVVIFVPGGLWAVIERLWKKES